MTPPRVVLDTNVLVSVLLFPQRSTAPLFPPRSAALLFPKLPTAPLLPQHSTVWLRNAWRSGDIRPLVSQETTEELTRVLAYPKFKLTDSDQQKLQNDYLPWCETITVPANTKAPDCRDPSDRIFLVLAAAAGADALITGDKDLLVLSNDFAIPILTLAAFREQTDEAG